MRELSQMNRLSENNEEWLGVRWVETRVSFVCRFAVGNLKLRIYKKSIISGIIINKLAHFRTYFDLSWMVPLSHLLITLRQLVSVFFIPYAYYALLSFEVRSRLISLLVRRFKCKKIIQVLYLIIDDFSYMSSFKCLLYSLVFFHFFLDFIGYSFPFFNLFDVSGFFYVLRTQYKKQDYFKS